MDSKIQQVTKSVAVYKDMCRAVLQQLQEKERQHRQVEQQFNLDKKGDRNMTLAIEDVTLNEVKDKCSKLVIVEAMNRAKKKIEGQNGSEVNQTGILEAEMQAGQEFFQLAIHSQAEVFEAENSQEEHVKGEVKKLVQEVNTELIIEDKVMNGKIVRSAKERLDDEVKIRKKTKDALGSLLNGE